MRVFRLTATLVTWMAFSAMARAEGLVTVRLGEQDTCAITGVTTVANNRDLGTIKFDLSKFPAGVKVEKAMLRFWINGGTEYGARYWGFMRWNDEKFDGFKVFRGPAAAGGPLDTRYPFNLSTAWLYEWDVTLAARDWLADPARNDGLSANFAFPADGAENKIPEWMRPYLQITLAGENKTRPKQPADLKVASRYGQTFITWKQILHTGAFFDSTYRVYRHTEPVNASNLAKARLLGEVNRLSQLNARRSMVVRGGGYCQMGLYVEAAGGVEPQRKDKGEGLEAYWNRCRAALPQRCNYVIEHDWEKGDWLSTAPEKGKLVIKEGPQLANDTGLFVFTIPQDGKAFYAVTSVLEGNENRDDFSAGNALSAAVAEKKGTPRAVVQAVITCNKGNHWDTWQLRDLAYWEGGDGRFHNTPSTAFSATMDVPKCWAGLGPKSNDPIWLKSHAQLNGYSTHYGAGAGSRGYDTGSIIMDTLFVPPTPYAPFPNAAGGPNVNWPEYGLFYYGSKTPPSPEARTSGREAAGNSYHRAQGLYGYMDTIQTGGDPRKSTVVPYWENRRMFELEYMVNCFPETDAANYTVVSSACDGLNFAIHHAETFGSVNCSMEASWRSERGSRGKADLVGLEKWGLKNPEGFSVWDWNDPIWYSKKFPGKEWPYVAHVISPNYDGVGCWQNFGYPAFYFDLAKEQRAGEYWWVNVGDAPEGAYAYVPRNQAVPAIFNVTCQLPPLPDWTLEPAGTLNGYVLWHWKGKPFLVPGEVKAQPGKETPARLPGQTLAYTLKTRGGVLPFFAAVSLDEVDEPGRFEMAFRLSEHTQGFGTGTPVPPVKPLCGAADITPRRLQKFKVEKGKTYHWKNVRVSTGGILQAGEVKPDDLGLLTVPGFFLDKDMLGNKLVITPAAGALPVPDQAQKLVIRWFKSATDRWDGKDPQTTDMAYADYAAQCRRPELLLAVTPGRKFVPTMTPTEVKDVPLYSEWAWNYDDGFSMPEAGRYRLEMRVKDAFFFYGAWPIIPVKVDNKSIGERVADSTNGMTLAWWVELEKGRHRFFCGSGNNVFNEGCPQVPSGKNRGLTIQNFEFFLLPPRPAASSEVYQVKIRQRSAVAAPNLTLTLSADVVAPWGEPLKTAVAWKTEGAKLSAEGVFSASAEGDYAVTATAGGKSDTVTVKVKGAAVVDDFDDEWADGWLAAGEEARLEKERASWYVWRKGSGWQGTLLQNTADYTNHLFVYEASKAWGDVALQIDRLPGRLGNAQGLVFRYQDPKNYYRFERRAERNAKSAAFKIVKVLDGVETVLASADKEIPAMDIQPAPEFRTFQYWDMAKLSYVKPFQIDRFRVEAKGEEFKAFLNGQEALSAKDDKFKQGAAGLFCNGQVTFDNFEAGAVK